MCAFVFTVLSYGTSIKVFILAQKYHNLVNKLVGSDKFSEIVFFSKS